jgi:hypothetical protein
MPDADELDEQYTADELRRGPAIGVTGRWDMTKQELIDAITEETGVERVTDEAFQGVHDVEPGDTVEMNHLQAVLTVTDVERSEHRVAIEMETTHGGRHRLVYDEFEIPHLERWRANDDKWMKNSTDPEYFRVVQD